MANNGWEDAFGKSWEQFFEEAQNTWKTVTDLNHGLIDPDAKERAENEARFEALEARVEALENKESDLPCEFIDGAERPTADVEFRWEESWHSPDYYPGDWTVINGVMYDAFENVVDEAHLKEFGFRKIGRWVSEWRDL